MVRKHQRIFARVVALVFCLTVFIGVTPAFADEAEGANASFYKLASVASTYLSSATANAGKTEWALPSNISAASAGGLRRGRFSRRQRPRWFAPGRGWAA